MNAKLFSKAIGEIKDTYYEEAANYRRGKPVWVKWGSIAACLAVVVFTAFSVLPAYLGQQSTMDDPNKTAVKNPDNDTLPTTDNPNISMDKIIFNEIAELSDAARKKWYDPELYDTITWDKDKIIDYYGNDPTSMYVPDGLTAAPGNGTARVFVDKYGNVVEDTVWLGFFHDYYEDGSPKFTEDVAAVNGFSITASKIGLLNDCLYILPENEVTASDIGGTAVTFGYRSMPYGPYDSETHEPSGYYDMYVAEFEYDGIEYQIVAEQMEAEEVVKVVSSIIFGKDVTVGK